MEKNTDYKKIRARLNLKKGIPLYENEEIEYLEKPLGKAAYLMKDNTLKKKKSHWSDRIKCNICGKEFTRSCRKSHEITKHHQTYAKLNTKMKKILLDINDEDN